MTDTRETERTVEGLRLHVLNELRKAEAEAVAVGRKVTTDELVSIVARAIVEYLGVTEDDVRAALPTPTMCHESECVECRPARALALLLEASR